MLDKRDFVLLQKMMDTSITTALVENNKQLRVEFKQMNEELKQDLRDEMYALEHRLTYRMDTKLSAVKTEIVTEVTDFMGDT